MHTTSVGIRWAVPMALAVLAPAAMAQTRAAEIERERVEKSRELKPERESRIEQRIEELFEGETPLGRLLFGQNGFGLRFGGLMPGSGFAVGPRYYRRDLANERVRIETSLVASYKQYWAAETRLLLPRIGDRPIDLAFTARHADAPAVNYFGSGSRSRRDDKSNFRREDTSFTGALNWRIHPRLLSAGVAAGANLVNIGPGISGVSPSSDRRFDPASVPGLARQSYYFAGGPYLTFDSRDWTGDPHRGTLAHAALMRYEDIGGRNFSFERLTMQVEQYVPFFNQTRVIALRARTEFSFVPRGDAVPFYLQSTLGGPDDLRGFERFRFYDNNSLVLNGEYRWEVATVLDMAVFADAGRVFSRPSQIGLKGLEPSGGAGFRIKTRNHVAMRFDTGFSREGVRLWLRFSNVYGIPSLFR